MLRRSLLPLAVSSVFFLAAGSAQAQNVLMNSAETINKGNFKIAAFPTLLFGEDDADDEFGVAGRFGYGFTNSFDIEGKVAFFDNLQLYGLDAEYWFLKNHGLDMSISLGAHITDLPEVNSSAIDTALLASGHVSDNLELYGGLNVSFESLDDVPDSDFTRVYFVPGLEYKIHDDLDLVAEFGIGLNDDSPNYVSAGLAFYIR
jgi:Outer membrane protein beta-barrel domain